MGRAHDNDDDRAIVTLEFSSSTDLGSAQQRISILDVSRVSIHPPNGKNVSDDVTDGCPPNEQCSGGGGEHIKRLSFPVRVDVQSTHSSERRHRKVSPEVARLLVAINRGKNRLVIRRWKRGACWWNLNTNNGLVWPSDDDDDHEDDRVGKFVVRGSTRLGRDTDAPPRSDKSRNNGASMQTTLSMARAEVGGYRLSRLAMDYCRHNLHQHAAMLRSCIGQSSNGWEGGNNLCVPEVLYFSHDDDHGNLHLGLQNLPPAPAPALQLNGGMDSRRDDEPWALLSYVDHGVENSQSDTVQYEDFAGLNLHWDGVTPGAINADGCVKGMKRNVKVPCHHYPSTMVKMRHEFGFDEPHPRHGRVPTSECLQYGLMILRDVIMPIHGSFFLREGNVGFRYPMNIISSVGWSDSPYPNHSSARPFQYHDMVAIYRHSLSVLSKAQGKKVSINGGTDSRMDALLRMMGRCVDSLCGEWKCTGGEPPPLPPALCHMDLQPQNLTFWKEPCLKGDQRNGTGTQSYDPDGCSVASVMDWEEACYADPRFEILLVCRKVLANREQADKLWHSYSEYVQRLGRLVSSQRGITVKWDVGPIEPWLKLESVHSLLVNLLQAMDLFGSGRSPWETKPDLEGKIDRERRRLVQMGWQFCNLRLSTLNSD